jgi:DNA (cytosine-5)-methyltransferase 1
VNTLDSARYHACGNAVSVPVAEWLGYRIIESLGGWLLEQQSQAMNSTAKSS